MDTNLRERRRRQTARDIHMAAVKVTLRCGYDHTTTEAIAAEAGISTRTFFNYYNNKQAAIAGKAAAFEPSHALWFKGSENPIIDDIVRLLGQALEEGQIDRQIMRMVLQVIDLNPDLLPLFRKKMDDIATVLTQLLTERLGQARAFEARLLAELSTQALVDAIQIWAVDDKLTLADATKLTRDRLHNIGLILCPAPAEPGA